MADILDKINKYLNILDESTTINEASSKYLQGWLNIVEKMFDDIERQYADHIHREFDHDNARELLKAEKEMERYCKNGARGAQKIANIFDKLAMKMRKGVNAEITVSIDADDLLGVVAAIKFEAWSTELNDFVTELRKAILSAGSTLYTDMYSDNKKDSYLYQDKETVYLTFGDASVKTPMPEYNEFDHFVQTKKNAIKFKVTF